MRNSEIVGKGDLFIRRSKALAEMGQADEELVSMLRSASDETSQTAVAEKLGIGKPFLNDILRNRRPISEKVWERAAKVFGGKE